MKVWIVNPFDNLPGEGYRPGRYEMMSRAFAAAGHSVVWWTSDWSHTLKRKRGWIGGMSGAPGDGKVMEREWDGGVLMAVRTLPYQRNISLARIRSHRRFARDWFAAARAAGHPGIPDSAPGLIIVSAPPLSAGLAALRLRDLFGCRVVVDVQDAWPETFHRLLPRPFRFLAPLVFAPLHSAAKRLYRGADFVTGVCDRYGELLRGYGVSAYHRFRLGHPAAGAGRTSVPGCRVRGTSRIFRVAYIGNLGRTYDLDTVRRAIALLGNAELAIAGGDSYLGEAELGRFLAGCDAGVVPMRSDSFVGIPNKVADYAVAGLPVVSSLGGECAELIRRTGAGEFYRPGDAVSLATALGKVRSAPSGYTPEHLAAELDGARIYRDYVRFCEEAAGR